MKKFSKRIWAIVLAAAVIFSFSTVWALSEQDIALKSAEGEKPQTTEVSLPDHMIINQVYGTGANMNGAVSHGFIELYNPTGQPVDLNGYSVQYASLTGEADGAWRVKALAGTIPPKHSFLIRCAGAKHDNNRYEIADTKIDMDWDMVINNDVFEVALVSDTEPLPEILDENNRDNVVDLLGATNGEQLIGDPPEPAIRNYNGNPLTSISKQKSARRKSFFDTGDNSEDFEDIDYREDKTEDAVLEPLKPKYTGSGAWGDDSVVIETPVITKQIYEKTVEKNANASLEIDVFRIAGAEYRYQWFRNDTRSSENGTLIPEETDSTYDIPAGVIGTYYYYCEVTVYDPDDETDKKTAVSVAAQVNVVDEITDEPADHVIINQVYGSGDDGQSAISHGFIELYNPTDSDIPLSDYSLQYSQGKEDDDKNDRPNEWEILGDLSGKMIKAHCSFLILCDPVAETQLAPRYTISNYDIKINFVLNNRAVQFALVEGKQLLSPQITNEEYGKVIDLVGAVNDAKAGDKVYHFKGSRSIEGISKQKSVRRLSFTSSIETETDFESLDYRTPTGKEGETAISEAKLAEVRPRYSGDGVWGTDTPPPTNNPTDTDTPVDTPPPTNNPTNTDTPVDTPPPTNNPTDTDTPVDTPPPTASPGGAAASIPQPPAKITHAPSGQTAVSAVSPPAKPVSLKLKNKKSRKLAVSWKKVSKANGYQVLIAKNKKFNNGRKTKSLKKTRWTFTKLQKKKTYFVKVRAYRNINKGKRFGKWSGIKKCKIKK